MRNTTHRVTAISLAFGIAVAGGARAGEDGLFYTDPTARTGDDMKFFSDEWHGEDRLEQAQVIKRQFREQAAILGEDDVPYLADMNLGGGVIPEDFEPWWQPMVSRPFRGDSNAVYENLEGLVVRTLENAAQIKVFAGVPLIRQTAELEAEGRFDPHAYFDYKWTDLDEPVGSTLKTGGPERFLEQEWLWRVGVKKTFVTGTEVDVSQRWGVLDNNSEFLEPKDQANTRLSLTVTQPLLNGAGVRYNSSHIDVARIDGSVALDEFKRQAESHLLEVTRAYWGLYLERALLLQRVALVTQATDLAAEIEGRAGFDATRSQLQRVRSVVLRRRSEALRSATAVRNAEARIKSLVNDPALQVGPGFELVPSMPPARGGAAMSSDMAMLLALENRPEIDQTFKQIRAAAIRVGMTKKELQPVFNLVVQYYQDGLAADGDVSRARDSQDEGDGSWVAGLVFDYPLGNREARARHLRRQLELQQLHDQLRSTLETVMLELQVSTREVKTAYKEQQVRFHEMMAARAELNMLRERSSLELADGETGSLYLEQVLDAQDRVTVAENDFLRSQVEYNVALANLDRATGVTLRAYDLSPRLIENDGELPRIKLVSGTDN